MRWLIEFRAMVTEHEDVPHQLEIRRGDRLAGPVFPPTVNGISWSAASPLHELVAPEQLTWRIVPPARARVAMVVYDDERAARFEIEFVGASEGPCMLEPPA